MLEENKNGDQLEYPADMIRLDMLNTIWRMIVMMTKKERK